jgi:hypothetical protein
MKESLQLRIPTPCGEDWARMQPEQLHRNLLPPVQQNGRSGWAWVLASGGDRAVKTKDYIYEMKQWQIIPLLIYVVIILIYLWFSTKFKKGWAHRCFAVKGGRINILLFIFLFFIVLAVIVKTTM